MSGLLIGRRYGASGNGRSAVAGDSGEGSEGDGGIIMCHLCEDAADPNPNHMCEACRNGDHWNCTMSTRCYCPCDGTPAFEYYFESDEEP